jgi:hypothetical protein
LVSSLPRFEKSSYAKHALAYLINWETYTTGESGMLLHRKGKLTIVKSKSSRLSYSEVASMTLESIVKKNHTFNICLTYENPIICQIYVVNLGVYHCISIVAHIYFNDSMSLNAK